MKTTATKPTIVVPKITEEDFLRSMFLKNGNPLYFIYDHSFGRVPLRRGNSIIMILDDQLTFATVIGSARRQGSQTVIKVDWMGKEMEVFDFNIISVIQPMRK